MRTEEERIAALHARMNARRRKREQRKTAGLSAACVGLTVCLTALIFHGNCTHFSGAEGLYTGSMMLFGDAGAYVLTAVLAFMMGAAVTVLIIRRRDIRKADRGKNETDPQGSETETENHDQKQKKEPFDNSGGHSNE